MSNRKPILLIDMDGVIADYYGKFLEKWKELYPEAIIIEEKDLKNFYIEEDFGIEHTFNIRSITTNNDFFRGLDPIEKALIKLQTILEEEIFDPYICSSPELDINNQSCWTEKAQWIDYYLGKEWLKRLILTKDKTLVHGDFLIDDKPIITGANSNPSWKRVVFNKSYNQNTPGLRLNSWDEWDTFKSQLLKESHIHVYKTTLENGFSTPY